MMLRATGSLNVALSHVKVSATPRLATSSLPNSPTECTKRKRKCDKQMPCGRCKRLKVECKREVVRIRHLSARHAEEIDFLDSLKRDIRTTGINDPAILQKIDGRVNLLQFGVDGPLIIETDSRPDFAKSGLAHSQRSAPTVEPTSPPELDNLDESIFTALEYMAWGRSFRGCYPHRHCTCQNHHNAASSLSPAIERSAGGAFDLNSCIMPTAGDARKLVEFHFRHLVWHHNCIHTSTFLEQCERFWRTGEPCHPLWVALYLSVLGVSSQTLYLSSF